VPAQRSVELDGGGVQVAGQAGLQAQQVVGQWAAGVQAGAAGGGQVEAHLGIAGRIGRPVLEGARAAGGEGGPQRQQAGDAAGGRDRGHRGGLAAPQRHGRGGPGQRRHRVGAAPAGGREQEVGLVDRAELGQQLSDAGQQARLGRLDAGGHVRLGQRQPRVAGEAGAAGPLERAAGPQRR
jgi:hypothetical protein